MKRQLVDSESNTFSSFEPLGSGSDVPSVTQCCGLFDPKVPDSEALIGVEVASSGLSLASQALLDSVGVVPEPAVPNLPLSLQVPFSLQSSVLA
jgi:hypothetical protein